MIATVVAAVVAMVLLPGLTDVAQYSWFIGMGLALVIYRVLAPRSAVTMASLKETVEKPVVGRLAYQRVRCRRVRVTVRP